MMNDLQVVWFPEFWGELTASLHDIPGKIHVDLAIPVIFLSAAPENYTTILPSRKDISGSTVVRLG